MADEDTKQEIEEVVVEDPQQEGEDSATEEPPQQEASGDDELESYSKGVQTRINKLTEKRRQAERDQAEAVRMSQQLLAENQKLKQKVQSLDTGYLSEYGTRLQAQEDQVKRIHKEAYENGDADKIMEAQQAMAAIAVEKNRYTTAKARVEAQARQQKQPQQRPQQPQQQQQRPQPSERAVKWKEKNSWFGPDPVMTAGALALHHTLEAEGFDSEAEEYYTELDKRVRKEFPHKFPGTKKSGGAQVAPAAASASRSTSGRSRSVRLTPSAVAIAKKLGVPLEEYAKYVKED